MNKKHEFKTVMPQVNLPQLEQETINYWKQHKIFEKSIESKPVDKTWTFLDGPPFITGLPHYGTLLSSIPKDLYPRYMAMKGYRVRRVWGWDCHGLPAENKVENKLGITRKKDIEEKVGVGKFISECKKYVSQVSSEWEWYIDHIGRWVDFKNSYRTMDLPYMESVMWVFKELYKKDLIYKGLRVSLYCPHCVTPISNFEVAMDADNYKEITEPAAVFKYQLEAQPDTYILAWSTTPWNKIATPALAVNPKLTYVKVKQGQEKYILAKTALKTLTGKYEVVEEFKGSDLVGVKFVPHYLFYKIEPGKKAFVVIPGDFVTAEEGTGVVTIAAYGEEDLVVMQKENIQIVLHVDEEGILKKEVPNWAGMYYLKVDKLVVEDLKKRNLIYRADPVTHTVPNCWRCHTRLLYSPQNAWYVNIQKLKDKMIATNKKVNWYPQHFKYGRYLKSLQSAPDWCISRSRYWGSPVPVWECSCGERFVPGSISELEKAANLKINDLHKPAIDQIEVNCKVCGKKAKRVSEVLDSWIEAGSASFAERHFPFDKTVNLNEFFPPDFITEYTGQIRAWFYVLHVIATALYDSEAFKNVIVSGVILGTDGRKMSKNFGNYPDPKELISKYGGDALRLYLMGSPVMKGEDILISENEYKNQIRGFLLILWNVYNFFVTYARIDKWQPKKNYENIVFKNILDKWILSRLHQFIKSLTEALNKYDTPEAVSVAWNFVVKELSTWYVRRIRDRVGPNASNMEDKEDAFGTLWIVLVKLSQALAPITPFITEEIYRNITGEESVHLSAWPDILPQYIDKKLDEEMSAIRQIAELGHADRKLAGIKVRQPLKSFTVKTDKTFSKQSLDILKDEINVKNIIILPPDLNISVSDEVKVSEQAPEIILDKTIDAELKKEGEMRELMRQIQILRKEQKCQIDEFVKIQLPDNLKQVFSSDSLADLKHKTLVKEIIWGEDLRLLTG